MGPRGLAQSSGDLKMATQFFARSEKAQWGFACNQSADGRLWAGKGYACPLAGQFPDDAEAVRQALEQTRGDRNGHFWVNFETRIVTIQIGASYENTVEQTAF
jgi:hypothetical protein